MIQMKQMVQLSVGMLKAQIMLKSLHGRYEGLKFNLLEKVVARNFYISEQSLLYFILSMLALIQDSIQSVLEGSS